MIIELVGGNYSIKDGMVNGAKGLFRHYTQVNLDIVWIKLLNRKVSLAE